MAICSSCVENSYQTLRCWINLRYIFRLKIEINTLTMTHTCILQMRTWMPVTPIYTHAHTNRQTHWNYSALLSHILHFMTQILFPEVVYSNNLCLQLFFFHCGLSLWLTAGVASGWKQNTGKNLLSLVSPLTQADPTRQGTLTTGNIKPTGEKDIQFVPCSVSEK